MIARDAGSVANVPVVAFYFYFYHFIKYLQGDSYSVANYFCRPKAKQCK